MRALCIIALLVPLWGCAATPLRVLAAGDFQPGGPIGDPLVGLPLQGDLRFVNLETPITARGRETGLDSDGKPLPGQRIRFAAAPERAEWLKGRFDVASLANNHALDQGLEGRGDTVESLRIRGVAAAWRDHDALMKRRGLRVSIVARDMGGSPGMTPEDYRDVDPSAAKEVVAAVRQAARRGAVIVSLHWLRAGLSIPSAEQRKLAAELVDAGASAVLGHGTHTPQGVERRGRAIIAYSLGNLAFGCRCTEVTDGFLLGFTLDAAGAARDVRLIPIRAGIRAPAALSHDAGLRELLQALSRDLGSKVRQQGETLFID
jgi:poly-gamma-glutamate capsule biosynthesis protein CapA/YwtB (metallophosphatase superfamily)